MSAEMRKRGAFRRARATGAVCGKNAALTTSGAIPDTVHAASPAWGCDGQNGKRLNMICINLNIPDTSGPEK